MRAEGAALDDAMRLELQRVPGLKLIDIADLPEGPIDSVRQLHRVDLIIRGAVDRIGDSVSATVRLVDAGSGREVQSALLRRRSPADLQAAATALGQQSLFGTIRFALDSILLDRWMLGLGTDSTTEDLRQRAKAIGERSTGALLSAGPRRMLEEQALADSLLAVAQVQSPTSALPAYARAELGADNGFGILAAWQYFPDSSWLPPRTSEFLRALPFANEAVRRAPGSAEALLLRRRLYSWLFRVTEDPVWRDSARADLRKASAIAGSRPDIWAMRAEAEFEAGLWGDARFSVEQGESMDYLHTNAEKLLHLRSITELALGELERARESCRSGASAFPGRGYFIACEAEALGRLSADPRDVAMVLALADSLEEHGTDPLPPMTVDELRLFAAAIFARAGRTDSGGRLYDRVVGDWRGAIDPVLLLDAVYARQALGDPDSALAMLARAVQLDPGSGPGVERVPWYQSLRRQPGYPKAISGISPREAGGR
jgi:tetratricopeptide (TPR) repeat protein